VHLPDDGKNGSSGSAGNGVSRGATWKSPRHDVCHGSRPAAFLKVLHEHSERYQLPIFGYCLMGNHYHIICLPDREDSMALAFGRANAEYSRGFTSEWIDIRRRQVEQLWRGRYRSCLRHEFLF
jgi:REP element-mobilizing transposase RayT